LIELKNEDTATLLRYFKWNKEKLVEKYMDSPDKVLELAGINSNDATSSSSAAILLAKDVQQGDEPFLCEICCDDDPEMETVGLSCGHKFCKTCYVYYTSQKIKESENKPIQCPQDGCNLTVDEKVISSLVNTDVNSRYIQATFFY
jgi:ariadne-1